MKKYNILKLTMFFWGISLAIVFYCALPSNVMAYGAPYDAFGINLDGSIVAPGGAGYPPLFSTNGYQWSYSPSYDYGYPLSYYNSYGGFGYGYQQSYNPYGYQRPYNYGWNQPSYGWNQPSYGWDAYNYGYDMYGWNNYPYGYGWNRPYLSGYNYWNFLLLNQPFGQSYVNYIDSYGRGYTPGMVLNSDGRGNYIWTPPGVFID